MDLDLTDQGFDAPNRPAAGTFVRELVPADLELLEAAPRILQDTNVKRISLRHHALARAVALGQPDEYAARSTGYTLGMVRRLKQDPAFRELVTFYVGSLDESFADMGTQLASLGAEALSVLHDRLEEAPEEFTVANLNKLVEVTTDRIGYGPKTTQVNVNVNVASRLEEARKRVAARTIEAD